MSRATRGGDNSGPRATQGGYENGFGATQGGYDSGFGATRGGDDSDLRATQGGDDNGRRLLHSTNRGSGLLFLFLCSNGCGQYPLFLPKPPQWWVVEVEGVAPPVELLLLLVLSARKGHGEKIINDCKHNKIYWNFSRNFQDIHMHACIYSTYILCH